MAMEEGEDIGARKPAPSGAAASGDSGTDPVSPGPAHPGRGPGGSAPGPRAPGVLRSALILIAVFAAGLAVGFLPQWSRARDLSTQLDAARYELEVSRLQSTLGAALAELDRGNYERARQLTSSFYAGLEDLEGRVRDDAQAEVLADLSRGRDEVITLLSRAVPEVRSRLAIMYTRYFTAMEPLGRRYGGALTTSPDEGAPRPGEAPGGAEPDSAVRGY